MHYRQSHSGHFVTVNSNLSDLDSMSGYW